MIITITPPIKVSINGVFFPKILLIIAIRFIFYLAEDCSAIRSQTVTGLFPCLEAGTGRRVKVRDEPEVRTLFQLTADTAGGVQLVNLDGLCDRGWRVEAPSDKQQNEETHCYLPSFVRMKPLTTR